MSKAQRGEPLQLGKAPGKRPKIGERERKLLEEDLKDRPFARLSDRCDYLLAVAGVRVSHSRFVEAYSGWSKPLKRGGYATQRDEF